MSELRELFKMFRELFRLWWNRRAEFQKLYGFPYPENDDQRKAIQDRVLSELIETGKELASRRRELMENGEELASLITKYVASQNPDRSRGLEVIEWKYCFAREFFNSCCDRLWRLAVLADLAGFPKNFFEDVVKIIREPALSVG